MTKTYQKVTGQIYETVLVDKTARSKEIDLEIAGLQDENTSRSNRITQLQAEKAQLNAL